MRSLSHWSGQQQHLLKQLQALSAQEMHRAHSSAWQRTLITVVHSARELHAAWTADHRGKFVEPIELEMVASSCYLGDMLSAADGCELSITTGFHNRLEEVQGAATSSLFPPSHFQDTWSRLQLLCAECNAQTDLQCQAARHCHHQIQ